jgi:hypothetical protein
VNGEKNELIEGGRRVQVVVGEEQLGAEITRKNNDGNCHIATFEFLIIFYE